MMATGKLYAANVPSKSDFKSLSKDLQVTGVEDLNPDTNVTILRDGAFQSTHHSLKITLTNSETGATTVTTMTGNSGNVTDNLGNPFILEGCRDVSELCECKSSGQDYVSEV